MERERNGTDMDGSENEERQGPEDMRDSEASRNQSK